MNALIDTGAAVSLIRKNKLQTLDRRAYTTENLSRFDATSLSSADHGQIPVLGKVCVTMNIGGVIADVRLLVVEHLTVNLIFGKDLLDALGANIDCAHDVVNFFNGEVQLRMSHKAIQHSFACLTRDTRISPGTEKIVQLKLQRKWSKDPLRQIAFLEGAELTTSDQSNEIGIARALVRPVKSKAFCRIFNPFPHEINIPKRQIIAELTELNPDSVLTVQESVPNMQRPTHRGFHQPQFTHVRRKTCAELGIKFEPSLDDKVKRDIANVIEEYSDIFATKMEDIKTPSKLLPHKITIQERAKIRHQKQFRLSPKMRQEQTRQINDMLKAGICEHAPPGENVISPMLMIRKADGRYRAVLDMRRVNEVTVEDPFNPPLLEDVIAEITDKKEEVELMSKLDLFSGFNQQLLDPESRRFCCFQAPSGEMMRLTRSAQGARNSASYFQRAMVEALRVSQLRDLLLFVYIDDVILASSKDTHAEKLARIFEVFRRNNLKLRPDKCEIGKKEVIYLGFRLSHKGFRVDDSRVKVIRDIQAPNNVKGVQQILGFFTYYKKLIRNYSCITEPIRKLLRKDEKFMWTQECQNALDELKTKLSQCTLLMYPRLDDSYVIHTDASLNKPGGVGFTIEQSDPVTGQMRPIMFGGRALTKAERNYTATEIELLAILYALKQCRMLLLNAKQHTIITDHVSLSFISSMKRSSGRLLRWYLILEEFNLKILYKPGHLNLVPDFISRSFENEIAQEQDTELQEVVVNTVRSNNAQAHVHRPHTENYFSQNNYYSQSHYPTAEQTLNRAERFSSGMQQEPLTRNFAANRTTYAPDSERENIYQQARSENTQAHMRYDAANISSAEQHSHAINSGKRKTIEDFSEEGFSYGAAANSRSEQTVNSFREKPESFQDHRIIIAAELHAADEPEQMIAQSKNFLHENTLQNSRAAAGSNYAMQRRILPVNADNNLSPLAKEFAPRETILQESRNKTSNSGTVTDSFIAKQLFEEKANKHGIIVEPILIQHRPSVAITESDETQNTKRNTFYENTNLPEFDQNFFEVNNFTQQRLQLANRLNSDNQKDLQNIHQTLQRNNLTAVITDQPNDTVDQQIDLTSINLDMEHVDLLKLQQEDESLMPLIRYLRHNTLPSDDKVARKLILESEFYYLSESGVLCRYVHTRKQTRDITPFQEVRVLPKSLREKVVKQVHEMLCHLSFEKVFKAVAERFYFPQMYRSIRAYVASCPECQKFKRDYGFRRQPLEFIPTLPIFQSWHFDIVTLVPSKTSGRRYLAVFVERLSRFVEAYPITDLKSETMCDAIVQLITRYPGVRTILTDRQPSLISEATQQVMKTFNIKHLTTSSSRPECDGLAERAIQSILHTIRMRLKDVHDWETELPFCLFALRSQVSETTGFTPYNILYATATISPLEWQMQERELVTLTAKDYMAQLLPRIQKLRETAKKNIENAEKTYKSAYDKRYRAVQTDNFKDGDLVWLKRLQIDAGPYKKLQPLYAGPFEIVKSVHGTDSHVYMIKNKETNKLHPHPINHSLLKKYIPRDSELFDANFFELDAEFVEAKDDEQVPETQTDETQEQGSTPKPEAQVETQYKRRRKNRQQSPGIDHSETQLKTTSDDNTVENSTSQEQNTGTQTNANNSSKDKWYVITKLDGIRKKYGSWEYRVVWGDGTKTWQPEEDITDAAKQEYHKYYTYTGHRRKRPRRD